MTLRKTCMVMVLMTVLGPLASTPALASGGGGSSFWNWLISLLKQHSQRKNNEGGGPVTNLPGPGAVGLVVVGLAATLIVSRRRKK